MDDEVIYVIDAVSKSSKQNIIIYDKDKSISNEAMDIVRRRGYTVVYSVPINICSCFNLKGYWKVKL